MLYFSYGSFMGSETLRRPAPSARFVIRNVVEDPKVVAGGGPRRSRWPGGSGSTPRR